MHPYGWLSIAPPLVTVVLAIVTKRAVLSLVAGVFVGALILTDGNVLQACYETAETHFWQTFIAPGKLRVLGFVLLMGGMIGVIRASGGMHGLVGLIEPLAKNRRRGQLATWMAGLFVFFDDYTNTLMLGATMRATCDRLRISREKLAYMVDSTAAPVAGIALLSTWVAVEIDYISQGLDNVPPDLLGEVTAIDLFLACIPYRFYIIQALLFVPLIAILGRDFGPMLTAERKALASGSEDESEQPEVLKDGLENRQSAHWMYAAVPLLVTLIIVVGLIFTTGNAALDAAALEGETPEYSVRNIFGSADSSLALFYGAGAGLVIAGLMSRAGKLLSAEAVVDAAIVGARIVLPALAILWCASTLSRMTGSGGDYDPVASNYVNQGEGLYTGIFLQGLLPAADTSASTTVALLMPTVVFLLASVVSFSTGTSYGTMGILFPVVAPIAFTSLPPDQATGLATPLMLATFGSVLAGAIFGDHCSPISDTTVLSSQSSSCDHVAHVVTQLPYAMTVALVCIVLGTVPLAFGISVWLLLPLQTLALAGLIWLLGQKVEPAA